MGKVILNSIAIAEEHRFSVANMARIRISATDGCTRAYFELERRRTNVLHRLAREVEVQSDDYL